MLDYRLIEALALVVGEGGFAKAARVLSLTQSAVSHRVKQLEDLAGQVLLVRSTPPELTDTGRVLLKHYNQVKRLEEDVMSEVAPRGPAGFSSLPVGVNADSLATWFLDAAGPFVRRTGALLDIRVDDQEQTHRMLRAGEVVGCISVEPAPMQGCQVRYLGLMRYRLWAASEFAEQWFSDGLTTEAVAAAPALVFNRKDRLQDKLLSMCLGHEPSAYPTFYLPSPSGFSRVIVDGLAYGAMPDQQARPHVEQGRMVNVAPEACLTVRLYWHSWNIDSPMIQRFADALVAHAAQVLDQDASQCSE